jgi:hypothetical protein
MSRDNSENNDMEVKTVNWMLEDFPDYLKQKCKEKAVSERKTLKAFVVEVLERSVGSRGDKARK